MRRQEDIRDYREAFGLRMMCLYDAMCMVSEREKASVFLQEIADHEPAVSGELEIAVEYYQREVEYLGKIHETTDGFIMADQQLRKLGDPEVREQIATLVLEAHDLDAEAVKHIVLALEE